ncbi:hypothetical protein L1987_10660 [Smallanthus sonchifolius]|uniref:Uncharacterized protein n=1 Tax=Smallanthus sonchifolius TaxID=185202 RepID=A0ACB9J9Q7_9ASTR|nr:hypothetical protein L1987_10660 [Smallanthus sonchifolius]
MYLSGIRNSGENGTESGDGGLLQETSFVKSSAAHVKLMCGVGWRGIAFGYTVMAVAVVSIGAWRRRGLLIRVTGTRKPCNRFACHC